MATDRTNGWAMWNDQEKKRKPTSNVQNSVLKMKKIQEYLSKSCDRVEDIEEVIGHESKDEEADTENNPKVFYIFRILNVCSFFTLF